MKLIPSILAIALGTAALALPVAAQQNFPSKPVTVVVPYTPNPGGVDGQARFFANFLEKYWKVPVIIENKPGAGSALGAEYVSRAAPDGYTFLAIGTSVAQLKYLQKMNWDPDKDLIPVSDLSEFITLIITNKQMGVKTWGEFVAKVKADPSKYNYGAVGRSTTMLGVEAMLYPAGVKMTMIPYPGQAQYLQALLTNDVQLAAVSLTGAQQYLTSGDLVALGVFSNERVPLVKDVPASVGDLKAPLARSFAWVGLFYPKGTPKALVDKLAEASAAYKKDPEAQAMAQKARVYLVGSSAAEFKKTYDADSKAWGEMTKIVGLKPE
jgi:tripartite-type tricarboxylate transporter receptor subunit TctC